MQTISLANSDEAKYWKEISNQEKESMMAQGQLFDVGNLSYDYLNKVDTLLAGVSDKINEVELTTEQKLEKKSYFPKWDDLIGESAEPEFNFQHGDNLFEVLQPHTFAAEWVPGEAGTESLYKKVSLHAGTKEDPIPWEKNMQLYEGKYYTEAEELLRISASCFNVPLQQAIKDQL